MRWIKTIHDEILNLDFVDKICLLISQENKIGYFVMARMNGELDYFLTTCLSRQQCIDYINKLYEGLV